MSKLYIDEVVTNKINVNEIVSNTETTISYENSPLLNRINNIIKNVPSVTWSNETISLNAGFSQVNNLIINGNVNLRSTTANSSAVLEIYGDLTINENSDLKLYKVFLIVNGNVIGGSSSTSIISTPNGANGGNVRASSSVGVAGENAISEAGGGTGGGNFGAAGFAGSTALDQFLATYWVGGGGGGAGGGANAFTDPNLVAGQGAGGGYRTAANISAGILNGGLASESLWINAGGSGGLYDGNVLPYYGAKGGGGAWWMKTLFLGSISNITFRTGKGGLGGFYITNPALTQFAGIGGQSGSMRIFLDRTKLNNVTFDTTKGSSIGTTRDGTSGEIYLHDILDGVIYSNTSVVSSITNNNISWSSYSYANDSRLKVLTELNRAGYYTRFSSL